MTIDKAKLRALAEAVRDLEDIPDRQDELEEAKDALWLHMHCHTILDLLAEIEHAWREAGNECRDWAREFERRQELQRECDRLKAEIARSTEREILQLAEIEALKAENEALRNTGFAKPFYQVADAVRVRAARPESPMAVFEAEILPALRAAVQDAERYRWTSTEGNWVARMFGKWRAHIGEYGDGQPTDWYPTREEAIDAAMSKESGQ